MILFACQSCAKVICVDDDSIGQRLPCPYCHNDNTIPAESMADCYLVYQTPEQPAGQPVSAAEAQALLEQGKLTSMDLIWSENAWRPLYQVLTLPQSVPEPPQDQAEIAVRFEALAPLPGFAPLSRRAKKRSRHAKGPKPAAAPKPQEAPVSLVERVKKVLFLLVALAILLFGVVRALRIFNYATQRFASVLFVNNTDDNLKFDLPFSGLTPVTVFAQSAGSRDNLVVGLPCKKTLKIYKLDGDLFNDDIPAVENKLAEFSIPIRPSHNTVVNFAQASFRVFHDLPTLTNKEAMLPAATVNALLAEISENKAPTQAKALFSHLQTEVKKRFAGSVNDLIFTDQDYNFSAMSISDGNRPTSPETPASKQDDYLLAPYNTTMALPGGSYSLCNEADLSTINLTLTTATYRPIRNSQLALTGVGNLTISCDDAGRLKVEATFQVIADNLPKQFQNGSWSYVAKQTPNGEWEWSWLVAVPGEKTMKIHPSGNITPAE